MILSIESDVITRVPRRRNVPMLARHVRDGWVLYYRRADGGAGTFVTGADTEELARHRAFAWLSMLRREHEYDQSLMCEWEPDCARRAGVMMRVCSIDRHYAACGEHAREVFERFVVYMHEGAVCGGCDEPYRLGGEHWRTYAPYPHIPFRHHCDVITISP